MQLGEKFIASCILKKNPKAFFELPEKQLYSADEKALYRFVKVYYVSNGELPTFKTVLEKFPEMEKPDGKPEYYHKELINRYVYTNIGEGVPKIIKGLKENPLASLEDLRALVSSLETSASASQDMPYNRSIEERYKGYEDRMGAEDGVTYLSTGNKVFDSVTFGLRKNDLWTYGGRAGTKKTWWICDLAIRMERVLPETFGPLLLITNEIGLEEIGERLDAIRFRLGYKRLMAGSLTGLEEERYRLGAKRYRAKDSRLIVVFNCSSLEDLRYKIRIYNPAAVLLDGSYLLEPEMEEGLTKTTYLTRNLKAIAKDTDTPIVNTTQLRKKTGKKSMRSSLDGQDQFFYGSYVQDSDFAIAGFLEPDMLYRQEVGMDIVKGRRSERAQLLWLSDLNKMEFNYTLLDSTDDLPEEGV